MKRANGIFEQIIERENLRTAFYRAAKGRRHYATVRQFADDLEANLKVMGEQIESASVSLGQSTQFTIRDPKPRTITAPCFRERVLHHAVINICEPVFERSLIADTFACRTGKGRIACLNRAKQFSMSFGRAVKMDVRKYFDSISHDTLKSLLRRRFKDRRLLELLDRIVDCHETSAGRGLPIGSLSSQHFANFYLSRLDRFVKESLRVRGYVRYMDDFVFWAPDSFRLTEVSEAVSGFLSSELQLTVKPITRTYATRHGIPMLGCRVFPTHLTLHRRSRSRFRARMRELAGCSEDEIQVRGVSLCAFTTAGGTRSWQFRTRVIQDCFGE